MRFRLAGLALACAVVAAHGQPVEELYRASAIVTGRDNLEERERGTREALLEVLAKVSADASVPAQAAPRLGNIGQYVDSRRYTDRKAGIQISDEQGTRDRSFVLEVAFERGRIDALLRSLGREPWLGKRPPLLVRLVVTDSVTTYEVRPRSRRGWGQREAIRGAGEEAGVPVLLPGEGDARHVLSGRMKMTSEGYWTTRWQLRAPGARASWTVPATTFDRAIDNGVWTAVRRMAQAR